MLCQENRVEEYRHDTEHKFYNIESTAISKERLSTGQSINSKLSKTKGSSSQVKQYVSQRPSNGTFAFPIKVYLGHVLYKSNGGFSIPCNQQCVPIIFNLCTKSFCYPNSENSCKEKSKEDNDPPLSSSLLASIIHESLNQLYRGHSEGENGKTQIVPVNNTCSKLTVKRASNRVESIEKESRGIKHGKSN